MKKSPALLVSAGFGSTLFILMIVVALAVVRPLFVRLTAMLSLLEQQTLQLIEDRTGLSVTYEKLSPSVLSGLRLKGVTLSDETTEKRVAEINQITVSYKLSELFSRTPLMALKAVSVTGVTLEYDAVKDGALLSKLRALVPSHEKAPEKERKTIDFEHLTLQLPFLVQLKHISLHYSDEHFDALCTVKQISLTSQFASTGVDVKTEGLLSVTTDFLLDGERRQTLASGFSLTGVFFPNLTGSTATLKLAAVNTADYTVTNAELLANYVGSKLQMRSMRSVLPYSLYFEADSSAKTAQVSASFKDFDPFSLVHIKKMPSFLRSFEGTRLDGTASLALGSREDGKKTLSYTLSSLLALPPSLLGSAVTVSTELSGSDEAVHISKLVATGKNTQASLALSYDIVHRQPSGTLSLDYLILKNGGVLSTEVYVEPYKNGFMLFSPQLFLGERSLTAVQLTALPSEASWDFIFECDDYSHVDYGKSAHLQLDGSYLQKSAGGGSYMQARLSVDSLFLDSLVQMVAFFLPESSARGARSFSESLASVVMNNEVYVSSDFKSFSFNAPYFLIANTQNDRELCMFAADGSNQTVQISSLEVQYGNLAASASLMADFERGFEDFTFYGDATVNALPYRFNGNYASSWLSVSGDYDFDAALSLADSVSGSLHFSALPVALGKHIMAFSADTSFSWSEEAGPAVEIYHFGFEDAAETSALKPRLALSGTVNHDSFVASSFSYTDSVSILEGNGSLLWNINNRIFDSIHLALNAQDPVSAERISLAANFTNPTHAPFSLDALKNDFYMSAETELESFPTARFMQNQNSDDMLSATATVTGTIANPFVAMQVAHASLSLLGSPLLARGSFSLDDTGVHILEIDGTWKNMSLSEVSADFNLATMNGRAQCLLEGSLMNQSFTLPLVLSAESASQAGTGRARTFSCTLSSEKVSGELFPKPFPFELTLLASDGRYDLFSSTGLTASLLEDGTLTARTGEAAKVSFELNGVLSRDALNLELTRIKADLATISSNFYFQWVQFTSGSLSGSFRVKGLLTDPEFSGAVAISNPVFTIPLVSDTQFKGKRVLATMGESSLTVEPTRFECGKGQLDAGVRLDFDRWALDVLSLSLKGVDEKPVPVNMSFPLVHYKGNALVDLQLLLTLTDLSVAGTIYGQSGDVNIQTSNWQSFLSGENFDISELFKKKTNGVLPFDFTCNLHIVAGNKVQILYEPFIRGLIVPDTTLDFALDSDSGDFTLKGDVALRGGEVIWLNRNFYMKEGRIVFNENQSSVDPRLTVRAETRERDDNGNAVTISLAAANQPVSLFNPRLSASPAKSESEIMELLGQFVAGDTENASGVAMASGDYLVNAMVMRKIENSLRELANFDIFSVRTMVLQNAVSQSTQSNSDENKTSFGNFFDNSAVYIGKYFGSSVYVDALMQWTYDETKSDESGDVHSLVFHPEFGFEMSSPFVNIRWGIAPDVEAMQTSKPWFVPSASITLSWKISF